MNKCRLFRKKNFPKKLTCSSQISPFLKQDVMMINLIDSVIREGTHE